MVLHKTHRLMVSIPLDNDYTWTKFVEYDSN
jgi:hypothetical protein